LNQGIDHLVLCVRDLDRARDFYGRLGFTTTPRATHPFGTGNSLAQFKGNFIELLAVVEPEKIVAAPLGQFSFADHNRRFLESGEGMAMLAFASDDARRDREEFARKGLDTYPVFDFARQATLPDGRRVRVAFSLAYVTDRRLAGIAFFVCQQHAPEYFWKPDYQRHANGATAISEVVLVVDAPASFAAFFGKLQSDAAVDVAAQALTVTTARGRIVVLDPAKFSARFPAATARMAGRSPRFAAYQVAVHDLGTVEALLAKNDLPFRKFGDHLQVSDADALGVVVEFAARQGA
jgi:catechol 2,3-dioxygenase-like lactoylglutathione lyase family enzyme